MPTKIFRSAQRKFGRGIFLPVKPGAPLPPRRDLFCAMQFNSIDFLIYFPIVTLLYFLLPQKIKWV